VGRSATLWSMHTVTVTHTHTLRTRIHPPPRHPARTAQRHTAPHRAASRLTLQRGCSASTTRSYYWCAHHRLNSPWQALAHLGRSHPAMLDVLKPFLTADLRPTLRMSGSHR
jgi:hypothetical protein